MRKIKFLVKAMLVCIMPMALLSCGNDEESGPGEPENGIKGLATVNSLSVRQMERKEIGEGIKSFGPGFPEEILQRSGITHCARA